MAGKQKILVVEDESSIASFISAILEANGFEAMTAHGGREAYSAITSHCPDAVILDLGLPDMDGMKIIRAVREWSTLPIVVVSARTHERDKVEALDAGADDYITKPFGTSELMARIRTALRHTHTSGGVAGGDSGTFRTGELTVDYDKRRVFVSGEDAHLTQNEYKIVSLLSKFAGRVLTYDVIIRELWGPGAGGDNQILRVNMANIRRKIEKNPAAPEYIFTEVGVGYRMREGN
ncbi:MAG: response regulator transcription factor [Clostridia bacterium]|nr:response regulator transcription factor [Clostridia bacterium]